jgi:hypothetical protein
MFAVLLNIDNVASGRLMFKLTPEMRHKLMREMLPTWPWSENVRELCEHFITAHKILISGSEKAIILYKARRDGKLALTRPSLQELRQIADDMAALAWFATQLSTMIRFKIFGHKPLPGDFAFDTWPDKPPLPIPLEYTEPPPPVMTRSPPAVVKAPEIPSD